MDTFCEQIVKIKKGAKFYLGYAGLILGVLVIGAVCYVLARIFPIFSPVISLLILGAIYGAYKLSTYLSVEYEYIITNGTFDIDIIYSKRLRKRIYSFELADVESIEKFNPNQFDKSKFSKSYVACNTDDEGAYKFVVSGESSSSVVVVAPNEKTRTQVVKFVPKFVGNTAFR